MKIKAPIDKCPHCHSEDGYYTKDYIKGKAIYRHNFDGSEADNSGYYDHLKYITGKYAYCQNCNKDYLNYLNIKNKKATAHAVALYIYTTIIIAQGATV